MSERNEQAEATIYAAAYVAFMSMDHRSRSSR